MFIPFLDGGLNLLFEHVHFVNDGKISILGILLDTWTEVSPPKLGRCFFTAHGEVRDQLSLAYNCDAAWQCVVNR